MNGLFQTIYRYQAWANADLFEALDRIGPEDDSSDIQAGLRLLGHSYIVARIFAAHLEGVPHGFTADEFEQTPSLDALRTAVAASDRWYLDYLRTVSPDALAETLSFIFTDGDRGSMTREVMLTHVALHGGYHRGEVGRILRQRSIVPPWDTFAVHLHQSDPGRRA